MWVVINRSLLRELTGNIFKRQWTPLHFACLRSASLEVVHLLAEHGADVKARNSVRHYQAILFLVPDLSADSERTP
jgi:ankyrin repeat protein